MMTVVALSVRGAVRDLVRWCGVLVLAAGCGLAAMAQKIPETHAKTLAGGDANLPADLRGKVGVLVLGFSKKSSNECHGWDDQLSRDFAGSGRVVYYEMPVLEDVPGFVRGMLVRSIRNGLPANARGRFLPVVQNEAVWKTAAGFAGDTSDDAYVLLVDDAGVVKWRTHGAFSAGGYGALKAALAGLEK